MTVETDCDHEPDDVFSVLGKSTCGRCLEERINDAYKLGIHSGAEGERGRTVKMLSELAGAAFMRGDGKNADTLRGIVAKIEAVPLPERPPKGN